MNWLSKILSHIRNQPEHIRKIILWSVVISVGIILFFFWLKSISYNLQTFKGQEFFEQVNLPEMETGLENLPKIDSEKELKQLEEELNNLESPEQDEQNEQSEQ